MRTEKGVQDTIAGMLIRFNGSKNELSYNEQAKEIMDFLKEEENLNIPPIEDKLKIKEELLEEALDLLADSNPNKLPEDYTPKEQRHSKRLTELIIKYNNSLK